MRSVFRDQGGVFFYIDAQSRIPAEHPLRQARKVVREALKGLSRNFDRLYSHEGRSSIPTDQLLSALLLQVLSGPRTLMSGLCPRGNCRIVDWLIASDRP